MFVCSPLHLNTEICYIEDTKRLFGYKDNGFSKIIKLCTWNISIWVAVRIGARRAYSGKA